ncbi:hypothetical protein [Naasia aerilata]|uniref:Uncharacterized protein n=1 Tax=Naasia aerilata TaxID=1162966 RepID=A0ABM8GF32_9MICO|nr:hypothetical protein [Naasia aerilata]BDZ46929.1 hypothetical protein GCM10025866_28380 [Naasia aerilata]
MTNAPGLSERAIRELTERGRDDLHPVVEEAVRNVAASHAGRPLDEVQAVLHQAVQGATHVDGLLSDDALLELAQTISHLRPHA